MQIDDRFQPGTVSWSVEDWRPDAACIRAGDEYVALAVACWSGQMSDLQMRRRLEQFAAHVADEPVDIGPMDAAFSVADHCAVVGWSSKRTAYLLARLSVMVPGWLPCDADEIAALVRSTRAGVR
jgi:hypothetical protein